MSSLETVLIVPYTSDKEQIMNYSPLSGFNLIHRNDLLNALLALQSVHQTANLNYPNDREREIYQAGFEAALLAVAQMLGQSEIFLTQKAKLKILPSKSIKD